MTDYFIGIFETPFLHIKVKKWEEKKKKLKDLLSNKRLINIKQENIITDFHTCKNYTEEVSEILKYELLEIYNIFHIKNYFVRNCWFETAKNGMNHGVHNHGVLGLSAVCFIDYDPKHHTPTQLISNHPTVENEPCDIFVPEGVDEGSIIVFPSNVLHFTAPNNSDVERTILAFNLNKQSDYIY